jgi:zinc D-Ala-D-Ala dipeptidase
VAPGLVVEARYAGSHNFVGVPIDGYDKPLCYLTRPAAAALAQVVADLEPRGLTLKVFDCYRPERAVAHFVRWARNLADVKMKPVFYPHVDKSTLFSDGYIASRSGHSRGSTVDLTVASRAGGKELDMGTPFDFFSPRSWPSDTSVSVEAQANRALLAQAMRKRGFVPYNKEWWHFTLRHEPYPQTYFDFQVR